MRKLFRNAFFYLALAVIGVYFIAQFLTDEPKPKSLDVGKFQKEMDAGNVKEATLRDRDHIVVGKLDDGTKFSVKIPQEYADELATLALDAKVPLKVDNQRDSTWFVLLMNFGPFILIMALIFLIMNQGQGGGRVMSFGKSRAKVVGKDQPTTTFADVASLDEAIEELQEIKDFLASPEKFKKMGAKIPKGVLLFGPPGTGKTLLAKAVAGEAGVPFFSISGSDFVEMFVGVGASRVRDLFEKAKAAAPAIIFVDEIDAVGRHRGAGLGGGHDEREQTLNQLLVEMDGFEANAGVILIAATNRPDILDPALLRPGRFDRQIVVDRPDLLGRRAILEVHAAGKPLAADVDLDVIARRTPGFTGADLANLMNEGALLAARRDKEIVSLHELEEAVERVIAGPERRSRVISDKEKAVIAYHESGHALVGHALPHADPVHKVSIIPRGSALGYTLSLPTEDKFLTSASELNDDLAVLLGGRTAEEIVFSELTTGSENDIDRATKIARKMVTEFGMSDALGPMKFGQSSGEVFLGKDFGSTRDYSDIVAAQIDAEVRRLVVSARATATAVINENREALDALANALMERETVGAEEVATFFANVKPYLVRPVLTQPDSELATPQ